MLSAKKGVVTRNATELSDADIAHLVYLRVRRIQILVFERAELQVPGLLRAQEAIPGLEVTVRPYASNIITFNPVSWAKEVRRRVAILLAAGVNVVAVIPNNEPNIEAPDDWKSDGWYRNWERQAEWYRDFAVAYHLAPGPAPPLDLAALSPQDPRWTEGLDVYASWELGLYYAKVDAHCYPGSEGAYEAVHARFPNQPVSVSEFNRLDPVAFFQGLPDYVDDAFYFILAWENPDPSQPDTSLIGSEYYEPFAKAGAGGSMTKRESWLTDMWERANVRMHDPHCAFFTYAKKVANEDGRAIVPLPSPDGNFENHTDPDWVVAYTSPPLYADPASWTVREGLPPLP